MCSFYLEKVLFCCGYLVTETFTKKSKDCEVLLSGQFYRSQFTIISSLLTAVTPRQTMEKLFCFVCLVLKILNPNIKRILGTHTSRSTSASILEPHSMTSYPLFFISAISKVLGYYRHLQPNKTFSVTNVFSLVFED